MAFKHIRCTRCGGELIQKGEAYICPHCNATFVEDYVEQNEKLISEFLTELKQEKVAALRQRLWEQINATHLSSTEILEISKEIKSYLPEDFLACFYEKACSKNRKEVNKFLSTIDYDKEYPNLDLVIEFMIKSITEDNLIAVNNLIEAYKDRDLNLYDKYTTELSKEAEKVKRGVYLLNTPRDVFIAYSSKDIEIVEELTEFLESRGISCFVALRNLRHGAGAVEMYDKALEEAMDNCKVFVFISTKKSRSLDCDAVKKEIPYIKKVEIKNAPSQYKFSYDTLPKAYKKPKIELLIDSYDDFEPTKKLVKGFFDGYEWSYTKEEVAERVVSFLTDTSEYDFEESTTSIIQKQYCINCLAEVPIGQKFCGGCGKAEFASSISEIIKIREQRNKPKEKHYCINCLSPIDIDINVCTCKGTEFEVDFNAALEKYKKIKADKIREEEKNRIEDELKKQQEELNKKEAEIKRKQQEEYEKLQAQIKKQQEDLAKQEDEIRKKEEIKHQQEELKRKQEELKRKQEELNRQKLLNNNNKSNVSSIKIEGKYAYFGSYPQGRNGEVKPIKWRILSQTDDELFLLSEYILDAKRFDNKRNNYANSEIRKWLNNEFYNKAFNEEEKSMILTTEVDNSARSTNPNNDAKYFNDGINEYACNNTQDKIFLLSQQEVTNSAYGFDEDTEAEDSVRQKQGTEYAKNAHNCFSDWWLRSPDYEYIDSYYAQSVHDYGKASDAYSVEYTDNGVSPALKIKLS